MRNILLLSLILVLFCRVSVSADSQNENLLLPAGLLQISEIDAFSRFAFVVDKADRKLFIYERDGQNIKKINEFPADIGKNLGNKMARDDHKTPEGIYFLEQKLTQPFIPFDLYGDLAFTTNYPNQFDIRENKTGSGIWLHAIPDTVPLTRGSRGCVVVRNEVIKKLESFVKLKETPILIYDKVNYLSSNEHETMRNDIAKFVEGWRSAWEQARLDDYMSYYDSTFKAPGFNFRSWKYFKKSLTQKYEYIKVKLSQPYILTHNNQVIVKTLQKYESDKHIDYGVKILYAMKTASGYKIVREEWEVAPEEVVAQSLAVGGTEVTKNSIPPVSERN